MKKTAELLFALVASATWVCAQVDQSAFFRIVSTTDSRITEFSANGMLVWTNGATDVTCMVQRATTLIDPNSWVDYVQYVVTNNTMTIRLLDLNPPDGMVLIPKGINNGTDLDKDFEVYSLTNDAPFYMDATEVTKTQWDTVYNWALTNGYQFDNVGLGKAVNHPVQMVNWYDCVKWCNARSQKEGRTPCYTVSGSVYKTNQKPAVACDFSVSGYRLPSNTEWEYAARGGLNSKRFPWGDLIQHTRANYNSSADYSYDTSETRGYHPTYDDDPRPYTSPVGSFAANGYGLYDMAGNVWEWCWDEPNWDRPLRGGSWANAVNAARCVSKATCYPV